MKYNDVVAEIKRRCAGFSNRIAMNKHYSNLEGPIKQYFARIGKRIEIEPSGSRGPDIKSADGTVVGEIKHATELARDLPAKFWRDWNKPNAKFGGKTAGETLVEMERLGPSAERISVEARGFVAVILGQLKHGYVLEAGLDNGWLVIEDVARWMGSLKEALSYIGNSHRGLASDIVVDEYGVGYVNIRFG